MFAFAAADTTKTAAMPCANTYIPPRTPYTRPAAHRSHTWGLGKAAGAALLLVLLLGASACSVLPSTAPADTQQPLSAQDAERLRLAQTRLQLGAMHLSEGRSDIALGEITQALSAYPNYPDAYNLQGWIYLSQRQYAKADDSFGRALQLAPADSDTRYNLGWSQCQQKKFEAAQQHFDAALQDQLLLAPTHARILLAKAVCLRQAHQAQTPPAGEQAKAGAAAASNYNHQEALSLLAQAYALEPSNAAIGFYYAQALLEAGDLQRAQFYAQRLYQTPQADAPALWLGLRIERQLGNQVAMQALADTLKRRFPASKEWQQFEQGAFDE